jgi:hypothetical protein
MTISGWGILLIFGADQAVAQTLAPYRIYNSATHFSANNELCKSIQKHALKPKLLGLV